MTRMAALLRQGRDDGRIEAALAAELEREAAELGARLDTLEELLITVVRTGWPWDGDGEPNAIHGASHDGYPQALTAARELLGLDHHSRLTRTEPRT